MTVVTISDQHGERLNRPDQYRVGLIARHLRPKSTGESSGNQICQSAVNALFFGHRSHDGRMRQSVASLTIDGVNSSERQRARSSPDQETPHDSDCQLFESAA